MESVSGRLSRLGLVLALASGCGSENDPESNGRAAYSSSVTAATPAPVRVADCVIDTIVLGDAAEFASDLEAAIDPALIVDFGGSFYRQVRIPRALQSPLDTTDAFGTHVYSFHGWDLVPHELVPEGIAGTGLFATLRGEPVFESKRVFHQKRFTVAEALFAALTRATEVRTEHIARPEQVYDESWVRLRRSTPAGRLTCEKVVYPGRRAGNVTYTCVLTKVEWKSVQAFDTDEVGGFCPSPP